MVYFRVASGTTASRTSALSAKVEMQAAQHGVSAVFNYHTGIPHSWHIMSLEMFPQYLIQPLASLIQRYNNCMYIACIYSLETKPFNRMIVFKVCHRV